MVPAWELATTAVNGSEGWGTSEGVRRSVRAVMDHERDGDGHLTTLDPNSPLVVLCTNVPKRGRPDLQH